MNAVYVTKVSHILNLFENSVEYLLVQKEELGDYYYYIREKKPYQC